MRLLLDKTLQFHLLKRDLTFHEYVMFSEFACCFCHESKIKSKINTVRLIGDCVSAYTDGGTRLFCCFYLNIQIYVRFVQFFRKWYVTVRTGQSQESCTSHLKLLEKFRILFTLWSPRNILRKRQKRFV